MLPQKTQNSQSNLKKEQQSEWHHISLFQTILQTYSLTELFDVSIEIDTYAKWNRIDIPDINLHIYG